MRDLPPNKDSLYKYIQRANFQAAIHRRSLECRSNIPPPKNHGWKMAGDSYEVDWMTLPPAPEAILELVHCACKKKNNCVKGRCTCKLHELPCTDLWQLKFDTTILFRYHVFKTIQSLLIIHSIVSKVPDLQSDNKAAQMKQREINWAAFPEAYLMLRRSLRYSFRYNLRTTER